MKTSCLWSSLSKRAPASSAADRLADVMLELQAMGCRNINLVAPTHVVPQILAAVIIASGKGLCLPLVYNSSGYDRVETLKLLDGVVDILYAEKLGFRRIDGRPPAFGL